tara:strand:- start:9054 stop:9653 length:600 start_codon:yes stop_codon:yes gene_type:complete
MPINIHGKEYVLVNERLDEFLAENPKATIDTVLAHSNQMVDTATGDMCNNYIIHAKVIPNPIEEPEVYYTGYAEERDNNGFINKTSALENAETSAIGRALAFAGYGSAQSIASGEEVLRAQQVQKNLQPTTTSLDKLDRAMNKCFKEGLIDEKAKLQYRKKREAGMTKQAVDAGQEYFDKLLGQLNPIETEKPKKGDKK